MSEKVELSNDVLKTLIAGIQSKVGKAFTIKDLMKELNLTRKEAYEVVGVLYQSMVIIPIDSLKEGYCFPNDKGIIIAHFENELIHHSLMVKVLSDRIERLKDQKD